MQLWKLSKPHYTSSIKTQYLFSRLPLRPCPFNPESPPPNPNPDPDLESSKQEPRFLPFTAPPILAVPENGNASFKLDGGEGAFQPLTVPFQDLVWITLTFPRRYWMLYRRWSRLMRLPARSIIMTFIEHSREANYG